MSNKTEETNNSQSCCNCKCCDQTEIAKFLRHIADYFDKN